MLEEFAKLDLFDAIAASLAKVPMKSSLGVTIGFFRVLYTTYPQFLSRFNSPQSSVMRDLDRALSCNQVDGEILDMLMLFAVNQSKLTGTSTFRNLARLKFVLNVMKDSDDEERLLKVLLELTEDSVINIYECLSCDVIGHAMERIRHDKFIDQCFIIFQRISSKFFSTLALREVARALRLDISNRAQLRHYRILHSIKLLMMSDMAIPVSSFFRFGDDANGIYGPSVDPVTVSRSFSMVTAFRHEEVSIGPLFLFHDMNESVLAGILESSVLTIQ
jgi:hypothetical protein